jgi:hypothetical protein
MVAIAEPATASLISSKLITLNNLGALYADLGRLDDAEKMCQRALSGFENRLGYEHKRCRKLRHVLAAL